MSATGFQVFKAELRFATNLIYLARHQHHHRPAHQQHLVRCLRLVLLIYRALSHPANHPVNPLPRPHRFPLPRPLNLHHRDPRYCHPRVPQVYLHRFLLVRHQAHLRHPRALHHQQYHLMSPRVCLRHLPRRTRLHHRQPILQWRHQTSQQLHQA